MKKIYVCEGTTEGGKKCMTILDQARSPRCDWPGCTEEACQKCGKIFPLASGDSIRTCWRHAVAMEKALSAVLKRRSVKSMVSKWCTREGLYVPTQRHDPAQLAIPEVGEGATSTTTETAHVQAVEVQEEG